MPSISCPECQKKLIVPDQVLGKKGQCCFCRHTFVIPAALPKETVAKPTPAASSNSHPTTQTQDNPKEWSLDYLEERAFESAVRKIWKTPQPHEPQDPCTGLVMFIDGGKMLPPMMQKNLRRFAVELGGDRFADFCGDHSGASLVYLFDPESYPRRIREEYEAMRKAGTLSPSFIKASDNIRELIRRAGL